MKVRKKFLSVLLSLVMSMSFLSLIPACIGAGAAEVLASTSYYGNIITLTDDYTLTYSVGENFTGEMYSTQWLGDYYLADVTEKIVIEEGYTNIPYSAFENFKKTKEVTIPDSVTTIRGCAFRYCTNLETVTIGRGIKKIGADAFYDCDNLSIVNIPDIATWCEIKFEDVTASPMYNNVDTRTKVFLYLNGEKLKDIVIPEGTTKIGEYAFYECHGIESISIPSTVTEIGGAFFSDSLGSCHVNYITVSEDNPVYDSRENCNCLIETATDTVLRGSNNAFIPEGVKTIAERAFRGCTGLKKIVVPGTVETIEEYAFIDCVRLRDVEIGDGVKSIGDGAFAMCSGLANLDLGNTVESIGSNCFSYVYGLKEVTIPASLKETGSSPFTNTCIEKVVVSEGMTEIPPYMFANCFFLKSIELPSTINTIGESAFMMCLNLEEITIPDGVTEIGDIAFFSCFSLTEIDLPESVETIGEYALLTYATEKLTVRCATTDISASGAGIIPFTPEYTEVYIEAEINYFDSLQKLMAVYGSVYGSDMTADEMKAALTSEEFTKLEEETERLAELSSEIYDLAEEECGEDGPFFSDMLIIGHLNSAAQAYAEEYGFAFDSCPLGDHTNVVENDYIAPTCTGLGYIGGSVCLDCESVVTMPETVPANGHKFITVAKVEPTCTTNGVTAYEICSVCNYYNSKPEIIEPIDCADANGDGLCDYCGKSMEEEQVKNIFEIILERLKNFFDRIRQIFEKFFK